MIVRQQDTEEPRNLGEKARALWDHFAGGIVDWAKENPGDATTAGVILAALVFLGSISLRRKS